MGHTLGAMPILLSSDGRLSEEALKHTRVHRASALLMKAVGSDYSTRCQRCTSSRRWAGSTGLRLLGLSLLCRFLEASLADFKNWEAVVPASKVVYQNPSKRPYWQVNGVVLADMRK